NFLTPYGLVAAQALRKAGFTVNILSMDWGTLANRRANPEPVKDGGWNIFHTSWPTDITNTPATNIPLASGGKDGGAWFGWPKDSQIQQWINQFPTITDSDEQKKLAGKIQKRAYELGVYFPVGEFLTPSAYSSRIKGALKTSTPVFWNMRKE
ncbi:MAG: ABC transporter substrate-binding protein, partial [Proteobacteria bacterium]|nr:ABC transporter substrate-binding protein [Pseudomonadota bacterium]